jgi:hypothetical protein
VSQCSSPLGYDPPQPFIFQAQIYQCRRMLFADGVGRVVFACSYVTSGFPPAVSVVFSQMCSSSIQAEVCFGWKWQAIST